MGRRILRMSKEFFCEILSEGEKHYRVIKDALPPNATIVRMSMSAFFSTDDIGIMLESSDWPEVPPGFPLPTIEPILKSIYQSESWRDNPQL